MVLSRRTALSTWGQERTMLSGSNIWENREKLTFLIRRREITEYTTEIQATEDLRQMRDEKKENAKYASAYYWDDPKDNRNEYPNNTLTNKGHHGKLRLPRQARIVSIPPGSIRSVASLSSSTNPPGDTEGGADRRP